MGRVHPAAAAATSSTTAIQARGLIAVVCRTCWRWQRPAVSTASVHTSDRAGRGSVDVGQHILGALLQGPPKRGELRQRRRDSVAERLDHPVISCQALRSVGLPVGADHALVDAPGRLDLDVLLDAEQRGQPLPLPVGEEVGAGVQRPAGAVERVALSAAVTVQVLLDPPPASVQGVAGEADDVERIIPTSG